MYFRQIVHINQSSTVTVHNCMYIKYKIVFISCRYLDLQCIPSFLDGIHLAVRLHLEAEHTNVLIIQVEVLQGCLMEAEVERMNVELILQEKPIQLVSNTYSLINAK